MVTSAPRLAKYSARRQTWRSPPARVGLSMSRATRTRTLGQRRRPDRVGEASCASCPEPLDRANPSGDSELFTVRATGTVHTRSSLSALVAADQFVWGRAPFA